MNGARRRLLGTLLSLPCALKAAVAGPAVKVVERKPVSALDKGEKDDLIEAYRRLEDEKGCWNLEGLKALHAHHCGSTRDIHKTWGFLPWHRALVALHERVLGGLLGKPEFRLPYWDWESGVPEIYTKPDNKSNPLWRPNRHTNPQIQAFITPERYKEMLFVSQFTGSDSFAGAEDGEGTASFAWPHQKLHTTISNEMGRPETAARDPLFYIHHTAVDRIWEVWTAMQAGAVHYPDEWLAGQHHFPSIDGNSIVYHNSELIDTRALGYEYSSLDPPVDFEGRPELIEVVLRSAESGVDVFFPSGAFETLERIGEVTPADTAKAEVYFIFRGLRVKPVAERVYSFWMTPSGRSGPALRLPLVGTFQDFRGQSEIRVSIPLVVSPSDLIRISSSTPGDLTPAFQLRYAPGDVRSETAAPGNAAVTTFDSVTAVVRRSRPR